MCKVVYVRGSEEREPRKSSDSRNFPFTDPRVPVMMITEDRDQVRIANGTADKLMLLRQVGEKDVLLAAWPGRKLQDVFIIDKDDYFRMEQILSAVVYNRG